MGAMRAAAFVGLACRIAANTLAIGPIYDLQTTQTIIQAPANPSLTSQDHLTILCGIDNLNSGA